MTSKKQCLYEEVLDFVADLVEICTGKKLQPETIISDFELAILNATSSRFPNSKIKGCWFHYAQLSYFLSKLVVLEKGTLNVLSSRPYIDMQQKN